MPGTVAVACSLLSYLAQLRSTHCFSQCPLSFPPSIPASAVSSRAQMSRDPPSELNVISFNGPSHPGMHCRRQHPDADADVTAAATVAGVTCTCPESDPWGSAPYSPFLTFPHLAASYSLSRAIRPSRLDVYVHGTAVLLSVLHVLYSRTATRLFAICLTWALDLANCRSDL